VDKRFLFVLSLAVMTYFFMGSSAVLSQEAEDDMIVTYGTVANLSEQEITLKEYNYELDTDEDVIYMIDASTQFVNKEAAGELQEGDYIELSYVEKDGQKMAKEIKKDEEYMDEELTDEQMDSYLESMMDGETVPLNQE